MTAKLRNRSTALAVAVAIVPMTSVSAADLECPAGLKPAGEFGMFFGLAASWISQLRRAPGKRLPLSLREGILAVGSSSTPGAGWLGPPRSPGLWRRNSGMGACRMKYAKSSTSIGCAAAILLSVPWAMPASAAPAYPLHVQCNESYRESRAHGSQGCLLNRVNFDVTAQV